MLTPESTPMPSTPEVHTLTEASREKEMERAKERGRVGGREGGRE